MLLGFDTRIAPRSFAALSSLFIYHPGVSTMPTRSCGLFGRDSSALSPLLVCPLCSFPLGGDQGSGCAVSSAPGSTSITVIVTLLRWFSHGQPQRTCGGTQNSVCPREFQTSHGKVATHGKGSWAGPWLYQGCRAWSKRGQELSHCARSSWTWKCLSRVYTHLWKAAAGIVQSLGRDCAVTDTHRAGKAKMFLQALCVTPQDLSPV